MADPMMNEEMVVPTNAVSKIGPMLEKKVAFLRLNPSAKIMIGSRKSVKT